VNIEAVARRTGVPAATLRKWEERYGVPAPSRTSGSQRRYGDRDVRQIEWLRDRLAEGLRISQAVSLLQRAAEPVGSVDDLREALLDAVGTRAPSRIEALVNQAFTAYDAEVVIARVVEPVLDHTGRLWERDELSVADEHFIAQLFSTKLRAVVDGTSSGAAGLAVLGCVPGERHEIGLLCLAVLLQADGWRVLYLGQDSPLEDSFALASESGAQVLCLSATMEGPAREAAAALAPLEKKHPSIRVLPGGDGFDGKPVERSVRALQKLKRAAR
jgi:MerR family transcriptional regulator, light-induced transcriptional regulator